MFCVRELEFGSKWKETEFRLVPEKYERPALMHVQHDIDEAGIRYQAGIADGRKEFTS